jgi:uncharacterized membrane protein YfcA
MIGGADIAWLIVAMVGTGLVGGVVAGLLGVGGGIVIVPVLEYMLRFADIEPEWRMHIAVATSLATIIPTSLSSTRAHHARGAVDWSLAKAWGPAMLIGAFAGSLLASVAKSATLSAVFGVVAMVIAIKMFLPLDNVRFMSAPPRGFFGWLMSALIGGVSAMMGIGGGTLSVPTMTLAGESIHRAVGTAAFFGLLISLPGTVGYLLARPEEPMPFGTVGLVSLIGVAVIAPGTVLTAPLGAKIAHRLSRRALSVAFGFFLFIVAARMLYRTFVVTT